MSDYSDYKWICQTCNARVSGMRHECNTDITRYLIIRFTDSNIVFVGPWEPCMETWVGIELSEDDEMRKHKYEFNVEMLRHELYKGNIDVRQETVFT